MEVSWRSDPGLRSGGGNVWERCRSQRFRPTVRGLVRWIGPCNKTLIFTGRESRVMVAKACWKQEGFINGRI